MSGPWPGRIDRAVRRAGLTLTLRRLNTLRNGVTRQPLGVLAVATAAVAGATSISFSSPNLVGILRAGSRWTIAGDATVYEAAADAEAAVGAVAVTLTAALAAPAAQGATVTITRGYGEYTLRAARGAARESETPEGIRRVRSYVVSAVGLAVTPSDADVLVEAAGATAVTVRELGLGEVAGYRIEVAA